MRMDKEKNFIDIALEQKLSGMDFMEAMTQIFENFEVYAVLNQYPTFVKDAILIVDYDYAMQLDGLDDVINGNLSDKFQEIIAALERCGAQTEVAVLKKAKELSDKDEDDYYDNAYEQLSREIAVYNDYDGFWELVSAYIDKNIGA